MIKPMNPNASNRARDLFSRSGSEIRRLETPRTFRMERFRPWINRILLAFALVNGCLENLQAAGPWPPIRVSEDAGTVRVEFFRSKADSQQTFEFSTADGDWDGETGTRAARAGTDYVATQGSFEFTAGERSAVVEVPVIDNGIVDGPRSFRIVTTNLSDGLSLNKPYELVRIEDNEVSPFLDPTFVPPADSSEEGFEARYFVRSADDGSVWVGTSTRLKSDGAIDYSFKPPAKGSLAPAGMLPDGSLLAVDDASPPAARRLVRLSTDGSVGWHVIVSNLVSAVPGLYGSVFVLSSVRDGQSVLLTKLLPDGSRDRTFESERLWIIDGFTAVLAPTAEGKLLVYYPIIRNHNSNTRWYSRYMFRLNQDGSFDQTFHGASLDQADLVSVLPMPDGTLALSGSFQYGLVARTGVIRLKNNGEVDGAFGTEGVAPILASRNCRIFALSDFCLQRLTADGTFDPTFRVFLNPYFHGYQGYVLPNLEATMQGTVLVAADLSALPGLPNTTAIPNGPLHRLIRVNPDAPARDFRVVQPARFYRPPGYVRLQVMRSGDTTGSATVNYRTRDLTAQEKRDYVGVAGPLFFAPLEVSKELMIQLMPTDNPRPREFVFELDQPSPEDYAVSSTIVHIAPSPQIVSESLQVVRNVEPQRDQLSMLVQFAQPGSWCRLELSSNLKDWLPGGDAQAALDGTLWFSPHVPSDPRQFFRIVADE